MFYLLILLHKPKRIVDFFQENSGMRTNEPNQYLKYKIQWGAGFFKSRLRKSWISVKSDFRSGSLGRKFSITLIVFNLITGCSTGNREIVPMNKGIKESGL